MYTKRNKIIADRVIRMLTNKDSLTSGLDFLRVIQYQSSSMVEGCIPKIGEEASPEQVTTYSMALMIELSEFVQELNWKPWKEKKEIDKNRVIDEFADVLAFLGILLVYLSSMGITVMDLADGYVNKTEINMSRFMGKVNGYDLTKQQRD